MALFTQDTIDQLREAVDIVELIGAKTDLRRQGSQFHGLCPFHDERTPSFSVSPDKRAYFCFGCGAKGDAIRFVQETENLDFPDAVELLGERYNVELKREDEDPGAEERRRRRSRLLALVERVNRFYGAFLWDAAEAGKARDYLAERGLSEETLREFGVGYSPSAWDRVTVAARRDGYSEVELIQAGIAMKGRNGVLYDRFRGRIMFPLADHRGRVRGFGARVMGEGRGPKYLNTSENDLFHKGRQLFGLHIARPQVVKSGRIVAVEGYTDVLALHQAGMREAVAIMGTSLTPEQLTSMARDATKVVLALDADRAGQDAMMRAARAAEGVDLQVVQLPEGSDPADLIAASGAEAFERLLGGAIEVQRFQVQRILADADLESTSGRDKALREARTVIATSTPDRSALRIDLIRELADRLGVPESYATPGRGDGIRSPTAQEPEPTSAAQRQAARPAEELAPGQERAYLAQCLAAGELGLSYLTKLTDAHLSTAAAVRTRGHLVEHFDDPLSSLSDDDPDVGVLVHSVVAQAAALGDVDDEGLRISFKGLELARIDRQRRKADNDAKAALARDRRDALTEM